MFPMIFESSMGLGKLSCDILHGTTQGWVCSNGNTFGLFFKCICFFTFQDIYIIMFLRCDFNGK